MFRTLLAATSLFALGASARETCGVLTGTVSDPSGATVPNAKIAAANSQVNTSVEGTVTAEGTPLTIGNVYFNGNLRELAMAIDGQTLGVRGTTNTTDNVFQTDIRTLPSRSSALRGQPISLLDLPLIKNFQFTERVYLQFRGEAINALNRAHFSGPVLNPRDTNFGRVTNSNLITLPREFQLGLRLVF